ncbi:flagellar hook-associated protein FlgL [bacterium]|nr:flagellar hook-associated protein FlgL [bacterium]
MSFRVTQNLLNNTIMNNLNRSVEKLMDIQSKLSSGKRLSSPSDDPVGTASAIRLRAGLSETQQLLRNIDQGETQLNTTDNVLNDMNKILLRAQELAIGQANVTADSNTRAAVSKEINALLNQFVDLLNTRIGNRYIFAGNRTLDTPFLQTDNGVSYTGDSGEMEIEIESGTTLSTNIPGSLLLPTAVDNLGGHANLNAYVERSIPLEYRNLTEMNNGSGVDQGFIKISTRGGQVSTVDLRDVKTLGDAAYKINSAMDKNGRRLAISAQLDETTQTLIIKDTTSPNDFEPGASLKIEEYGVGQVALQLGIMGEDTDGDGTINGRDLNPLDLTTNLENLHLGAGVELGRIKLIDRAGNTSVIDLSQAETLADVRQLINQSGTNLRAEINTGGNGMLIQDGSPVGSRGPIRIEESGEGTHTARDLGILTPAGGVFESKFIGEALDPQITTDTPLSLLNRGQGLNLDNIVVENGPRKGLVDLTRVSTVGGLIKTLNESGLDLKARINDLGTGVEVTSLVGGRTLKISDGQGNFSANLLGIEGSRDVLVDPVSPLGDSTDLLAAIEGETRLKDLNSGEGVSRGLIRITDSLGNSINIDIGHVNSIQGVINLINSHGAQGDKSVNVMARISDDQRSLTLIDMNTANTAISQVTANGNLTADFSDLKVGQAMVVNAFSSGNGGNLYARSADLVTKPLDGETVLSGVIETVNKDKGEIFMRTQQGELRKVVSLQPVQNLFSGQSIYMVGSELVTGEFQARSLDLVTDAGAEEQQISGVIESIDSNNNQVSFRLTDGSLKTVGFITQHGLLKVEDIAGGSAAKNLGINGISVVGSDRIVGRSLDPVIRETTKLSLLQGGTFVPGKISIANGDQTAVIDLSNAETVGDVLTLLNSSLVNVVASVNKSGTGITIESRVKGTTLTVKNIALTNPDGTNRTNQDGTTVFDTTAKLMGIDGSADILGNLYYLRNALDTNSQEDIQKTLTTFTEALSRILNQRTTTGARSNQMSTTSDRGQDTSLRNTEILSGIEDLDVVEAVSQLAAQENAYNAALAAAGRIILPSLLDYL